MRYTEVRMSKLAHELLSDLDKETVDFVPNYDELRGRAQSVLPTRLPGAAGQRFGRYRGGHGDQYSAAQPH